MARRALPSTTAGHQGDQLSLTSARTCVGCRQRAERVDLLRVVAVGDALVPDPRRVLPGRGAHVHVDIGCMDLAERRRAWPRALRMAGPLDSSAVREHVARRTSTTS